MEKYIIAAIVGVVCVVIGFLCGVLYRKKVAEKTIGDAEQQARRILEDGIKAAETKKKEALLEAKEEILRNKNETERELKERRAEISRLERKNAQKEEALDRKHEAIDRKEEALNKKMKENTEAAEEIERLKAQEITVLEQLSSLTAAEAKSELVSKIEEEAKLDAAKRVIEIEQQSREEADAKATNIITLAIQRLVCLSNDILHIFFIHHLISADRLCNVFNKLTRRISQGGRAIENRGHKRVFRIINKKLCGRKLNVIVKIVILTYS